MLLTQFRPCWVACQSIPVSIDMRGQWTLWTAAAGVATCILHGNTAVVDSGRETEAAPLIVLLDDGPVLQWMAVNTSDGTQIGDYWQLPGYDAIPPHPSCSAVPSNHLSSPIPSTSSSTNNSLSDSPPVGGTLKNPAVYWAVLQSKAREALVLVGVDLGIPPRNNKPIAPLVEVGVIPNIWGLFCGGTDRSEGGGLYGCASDAETTWCGALNTSTGTLARTAVVSTSAFAFAVSHTFDRDTSTVWAVFRGRDTNTNYLLRLNVLTGEAPEPIEIAGRWFFADMEYDHNLKVIHGLASVQNVTVSDSGSNPLERGANGTEPAHRGQGGVPPPPSNPQRGQQRARQGHREKKPAMTMVYGDLDAAGVFTPSTVGGGVPHTWDLDAFSSASDEASGIFYAFGAHGYTTPPGPKDGWNVVLSLDLVTGVVLKASDQLSDSHSVVAGAWGIEVVPGARPS